MNANSTEDRISDLESRLEFQDETITHLNNELALQQKRLFQIDKTLKLLIRQLQEKNFEATDPLDPQQEPPPPHY